MDWIVCGSTIHCRSLENDIDLKLVAFSKLGTNYNSSKPTGDKQVCGLGSPLNSIKKICRIQVFSFQPLLGGDSKLEDLQGELDDLLARLGQVSLSQPSYFVSLLTPHILLLRDNILCQVNEDMSGYAVGVGAGQSAAIHHTLQRHTEILQVLYNVMGVLYSCYLHG